MCCRPGLGVLHVGLGWAYGLSFGPNLIVKLRLSGVERLGWISTKSAPNLDVGTFLGLGWA